MSLYGTGNLMSVEEQANNPIIMELFFADDILRMNSDQIHEFCESTEAQILQEKQVLRKPTMMRLSKEDDKKRRVKLIAYQLAKDENSPLYKKLKLYTAKRKEVIAQIMNKYGARAQKIAQQSQKNYIKAASKVKAEAKGRR